MKKQDSPTVYEIPTFQSCRKLLAMLGLVTASTIADLSSSKFNILDISPNFLRDLNGLDKKYEKEVIKVALLYVGPGQEDEASILRNHLNANESTQSKRYLDFTSCLGWHVDMENHCGNYFGGLDKSILSDCKKLLYYSDAQTEIVFHESVAMNTDENDLKQIKKVSISDSHTLHTY